MSQIHKMIEALLATKYARYVGEWGYAPLDQMRDLARRDKLEPLNYAAEWVGLNYPTAPTLILDEHIADWKKRRTADSVTYQDCVAWDYEFKSQRLEITVYDGDNMRGQPTERRCKFSVSGPEVLDLFPDIVNAIEREFGYLVQRERDKELEAIELAAKARIREGLLA